MYKYYVNRNKDKNGSHEVHLETCSHLPDKENRVYVGEYLNCHSAVMDARKKFDHTNGCYYCARECHTS